MKFQNFLLLLITVILFLSCSKITKEDKNITVVFRFDDPSAVSSTETELKVIGIFKKHHFPLTFSVVPFRCAGSTRDITPEKLLPFSEEKATLFKSAIAEGTIDIAQHGYSHQMRNIKMWTEFYGMDYEEQKSRLNKGKIYLENLFGVTIEAFIPPYNTYDINTIKALDVLAFKTLSAGVHGDITNKYALNYIPMSIRLHQVVDKVKKARKTLDSKPLIVVMFHEYDFLNIDIEGIPRKIITFEKLDSVLTWLERQDDVAVVALNDVSKKIDDVSSNRFKYVKLYSELKDFVPGFLRISNSTYPEVEALIYTGLKTLFIYMTIIIVGILIAFFILNKIFRGDKVKFFLLLLGLVVIVLPVLYFMTYIHIGVKVFTVYLFVVGMFIGVFFSFLKKKN